DFRFSVDAQFWLGHDLPLPSSVVHCLLLSIYLTTTRGLRNFPAPLHCKRSIMTKPDNSIDAVRARLKDLFLSRSVSFGNFKLASGQTSTYYINSKKVLFNSEAIALLGELLYDATCDLDIQAIGGLEIGAIPMVAAAAMRYHQMGRSVEGFFVRKQTKEHGSRERVEGRIQRGDPVVVIDDVLTTG